MRIVTWNMGMAAGHRRQSGLHDQAWHYLLGLGPDLALVQESLPPIWIRGEGTVVQGPFKQWGSAVFSPRFPLVAFRLPSDSQLRSLGSYLALGVASLPDGTELTLSSVHAVDRAATKKHLQNIDRSKVRRPSLSSPRINDVVLFALHELLADNDTFLFAGDWNTARNQSSNLGRKAGKEFFDRVEAFNWVDCVWQRYGKELQTWFREGDELLQNDHAFCDEGLGERLQEVRVAEEAAKELRLSDHAPLILDFDVPLISMASFK